MMLKEVMPIELLLDSYNELQKGGLVGKVKAIQTPYFTKYAGLAYPYTVFTRADIEVRVNSKGEFHSAVFPTEANAYFFNAIDGKCIARTNNAAPYMLGDKLPYMAKDLNDWVTNKATISKGNESYSIYSDTFSKWMDYIDTPCSRALKQYVLHGNLISDLIKSGLLKEAKTGGLDTKSKLHSATNRKSVEAVIKFVYVDDDMTYHDVGLEKDFIESWKKFYDEYAIQTKETNYCYDILTGEKSIRANSAPKVSFWNGAKLIASNELTNFCGRFRYGFESFDMSFETMSKVFNMLEYLESVNSIVVYPNASKKDPRSSNHGFIWNSKGKEVPRIDDDFFADINIEEKQSVDTESEYRLMLNKVMQGYEQKFDVSDDVSILFVHSLVNQGHGAFTYAMTGSVNEYFARLYKWHESCIWHMKSFKDNKVIRVIKAPSIFDIQKLACGYYSGEKLVLDDGVAGQIYKEMISIINEGKPFTKSFIRQIADRVSRPLSYKNYDWDKVTETACACIRKYYNDLAGKEIIPMKLSDVKNPSRSMIWGMLWAMLKYTEYSSDSTKKAKAEELMADFAVHPARNWNTVFSSSYNYSLNKIKSENKRMWISKRVQEIMVLFENIEDYSSNKALEPDWVLGYNLQLNACFSAKVEEKAEELVTN